MLVILISLFVVSVTANQLHRERIPNGYIVPHPCNPELVWSAVGHTNPDIGGAQHLNSFGNDFRTNHHSWTELLCRKDSDGDGRSNGVELGDPDCDWVEGQFPKEDPSGHPGLNENSFPC